MIDGPLGAVNGCQETIEGYKYWRDEVVRQKSEAIGAEIIISASPGGDGHRDKVNFKINLLFLHSSWQFAKQSS